MGRTMGAVGQYRPVGYLQWAVCVFVFAAVIVLLVAI